MHLHLHFQLDVEFEEDNLRLIFESETPEMAVRDSWTHLKNLIDSSDSLNIIRIRVSEFYIEKINNGIIGSAPGAIIYDTNNSDFSIKIHGLCYLPILMPIN